MYITTIRLLLYSKRFVTFRMSKAVFGSEHVMMGYDCAETDQ